MLKKTGKILLPLAALLLAAGLVERSRRSPRTGAARRVIAEGEAYRRFLRAIDRMALAAHGAQLLQLGWHAADVLLKSLHDGQPVVGAEEVWRTLPVKRFWTLLRSDCAETYYAHPWAWDEIDFGGPAYPRAYFRLERGDSEPWEKNERRYDWAVPAASVSDLHQNEATHADEPAQGQAGSH